MKTLVKVPRIPGVAYPSAKHFSPSLLGLSTFEIMLLRSDEMRTKSEKPGRRNRSIEESMAWARKLFAA
jgi:hypothetical protein